jgi:hypothetical protein
MKKRISIAALILSCLWPAALVLAQNTVVIDWNTKTLLQAPSEVNINTAVNVSIRNVNDFLYKYDVTVKATPRSIDDFAKIPSTGVSAAALGLSCVDKANTTIVPISDLENVIDTKIRPQADKNGDYPSIPIGKTVAAWNTNIEVPMKAAQEAVVSLRQALGDPIANCSGADDNAKRADANAAAAILRKYDDIHTALEPYRTQLFSSAHEIDFVYTLRPETDYSISVDEKYLAKSTLQGSAEFKFSPASTILTLSAGPLITWIPDRSYLSSTVPTTGGGTQNVLTVNDASGPQLQLATLLNYRIPLPNRWGWTKTWNTSDEAGIAISTGPVFRLSGSNSGTSSFGYFTGVSVHLWQRFFVTPGVHIGEFADFPPGFGRGTTIPPGFGTLTPVKRWTARLAIGITFKAADLSKVVTKPSSGTK